MIALDTLADLEAKWDDGTLTTRERARLVALSAAVRS